MIQSLHTTRAVLYTKKPSTKRSLIGVPLIIPENIIDRLEAVRVPVGPIYDVEDMMADPHYQARGMFETVEINGQPLKIPAILPKLSKTPGRTDWPGDVIGSHNDEVLGELLGLDTAERSALRDQGVTS